MTSCSACQTPVAWPDNNHDQLKNYQDQIETNLRQ